MALMKRMRRLTLGPFERIEIGESALENGTQLGCEICCARFVETVNFRVFNRQGLEVFSFTSGGENSILIQWDGFTNDGTQLPSGTYFYIAEVEFDVLDPEQRTQEFRGWLQMIR